MARRVVFGKPKNLAREYLRSAGPIGLVVHVGAHLGQEVEVYRAYGAHRVIWIEGDPETYARLVERLRVAELGTDRQIEHVAICALISDAEGKALEFHRFSNDGASSSVYPPTERLRKRWPGLTTKGAAITLRTRTLAGILDEVGIKQPACTKSLLVIDVQGHEAAVLAGLGDYARTFDLCECEISKEAIYEGGALYSEINAIFDAMGYSLVSHNNDNLPWHGDVIFRRTSSDLSDDHKHLA